MLIHSINHSINKPEILVKSINKKGGIEISVSDNGIGIDKKYQSKIFETFYRVPSGNIHDVKGYGIGLSYVKKMTVAQGGTISLTSKSNKGSTFILYFPNSTNE